MNEEERQELERSVNETVEEMKRKIEEITRAADEVEDERLSAKAKAIAGKVSETLETTSGKLVSAYQETRDRVQMEKTLDYIRSKSQEAADFAMGKLNELKNNPQVREAVENGIEKTKETALKVGSAVNTTLDKAGENENVRKVIDKVTDLRDAVKVKWNELAEKTDLDEKLVKAKDDVLAAADKAAEALRSLMKKEETVETPEEAPEAEAPAEAPPEGPGEDNA
ncbi:MAG: hypothetical protein IKE21_06665 [Erysipelotrichaceae bacterium]|nr:hypothetical protein [Erysipelotrichaceae bacterium]